MAEVNFQVFRRNLQLIRAIRGFKSAKDLSKKCEFKTLKRIGDLETDGRGTPTLDELYTISKILQVTIDELLFRQIDITFK